MLRPTYLAIFVTVFLNIWAYTSTQIFGVQQPALISPDPTLRRDLTIKLILCIKFSLLCLNLMINNLDAVFYLSYFNRINILIAF